MFARTVKKTLEYYGLIVALVIILYVFEYSSTILTGGAVSAREIIQIFLQPVWLTVYALIVIIVPIPAYLDTKEEIANGKV